MSENASPKEILDEVWKHLNCKVRKPRVMLRRQWSTAAYWRKENLITIREDSWRKQPLAEKRLTVIHEALHACRIPHQAGFRTNLDILSPIVYKEIWGEDEVWKELIKQLEDIVKRIKII